MALSTRQAMAWDNVREAAAVALLKSWTLDRPLPTLETIGDLPDDLYEALLDEVGGVSAADIETDFSAPAKKSELPGTPFGDSASLDTPSKATRSKPPTPTPSSDGESTDTAPSTPG
jgi:hypothetical protein